MPKVSIIVPTYNVAQYLDQCMTSLVHQTLKDIEIIAVNDGSTDNSLDILKSYAQKDSRIRIIDKKNEGYGVGMNIGLDNSRGEYVGIVEPDDYVKTTMYEALYSLAKEHDADIVKADFYRFIHDEEGRQIDQYNALWSEKEAYNHVVDPREKPEVFKYIMNTWSGIYRRSFIEEHHIRHHETPGASFQDNGFWFKTFCYAKRLYFVDKPYYMNRRDNPNSSVHNKAKVFCMNDEYLYIHEFLDRHPDFKERYMGYYSFKRFHNYIASYYRIGDEFKEEYLERFQKEFREAEAAGELWQDVFTQREWELIQILLRNAEAFQYAEQLHRKNMQILGLRREVKELRESTTFRIGKMIMYLPCLLKEKLKNR